MRYKFINLTAHDISIETIEGTLLIPMSGIIATIVHGLRAPNDHWMRDTGIAVSDITKSTIMGMADLDDFGTTQQIVSAEVLAHIPKNTRVDYLSPGVHHMVGNIMHVQTFIR
jgi:hypothetical protein